MEWVGLTGRFVADPEEIGKKKDVRKNKKEPFLTVPKRRTARELRRSEQFFDKSGIARY